MPTASTTNRRLSRPRIKPSVEVFPARDGNIYILRCSSSENLVIRRADAAQRALFALLDGSYDMTDLPGALRSRFRDLVPDDIEQAIEQLHELGVVEDLDEPPNRALTREDLERYEHQLEYFAEVASIGVRPSDLQARLKSSRVTVLGLGGLGSWIAYAMACAGIGHIDAVDGDTVELSNLSRQILYTQDDVGHPKAWAAARTLRSFNPSIDVRSVNKRLESQSDVEHAIAGSDFVVAAADWPIHVFAHWVNAGCLRRGIPHVAAGHIAPIVRVGPTYVPGQTGCLECHEQLMRERDEHFDELMAFRRARPASAPTLGTGCALIGSFVAMDIVHHLTGICPPATLGTAWLFDLRTMSAEQETFQRRADCPACGSFSTVSSA